MAHFLRGKQAGIQRDLSEGLSPELFALDQYARYGVNSRISALAYDPVQSLIAVGTSDSQFGSGQIYVFGQRRVSVVFNLPRKGSAKFLEFCADKLISVDSKSELCLFSLEAKRMLVSYAPPSHVSAIATDPSVGYVLLGLQNGETIAYDMDRETLAPWKIPNFWAERNPRIRMAPVLSLSFAPRDIGKLLIGYPDGAVIYSFKQNVAQNFFEYTVPAGAPGVDSDPTLSRDVRKPKLKRALWHPTNIFIVTVHEDTSLVFWDAKDGRLVMARTIEDSNINEPGTRPERSASSGGTFTVKDPIFQIAWCAKENPDNTGLLIAGGCPSNDRNKGLTFLDLGLTPNYQTSSWQILSKYFETPRSRHTLPVPPGAEVVDFCIIPRSSPYFAGAQDPIAIIALLSSGELVTLSFPNGHPISPSNMLHISLSFVHPFVNKMICTPVSRSNWLGLKERRALGPKFLLGGAESKRPMKRFEDRNISVTAHADGIIRLWDAGHDDEIENGDVIQVDMARAVARNVNTFVSQLSFAGASGELSVGLRNGEIVIFRWGRNQNAGSEQPPGANAGPGQMTNITHRADPNLKDGLLPLTLLETQNGPVTALKHSDVGFVCAGFEEGNLVVIDLRGPAIIYNANTRDFAKANKRASIRRSRTGEKSSSEWATSIQFGVLTLEGEDYSSICCFVGTNRGNLATLKILPSANGTYSVAFAGSVSVDDSVLGIHLINADTGEPALATQNVVAALRNGAKVNGVVVAVTSSGCKIFKPATNKGASKTWDDFICYSAGVVKTEGHGYSIVGLFGDGNARAYSIPGLKEIGCTSINGVLDVQRLSDAVISPSGDVLGWSGPSELAIFNVWGAGAPLPPSEDKLYNAEAVIPPRPTISNFQWISGTQYVSPADMDLLISGPDRPPSKRMMEQLKFEERERRKALREGRTPPELSGSNDEGYWAYMQRQVQERTERLGITGDSMDRLEENSSNWANDVSKFVSNQKRKAVLGAFGSKFGF
ncbi:putative snare-dependent exocytosis protein [Talaromyces proteolyticus]|uniref:Snare-dependent exocytosis protein n=1 Tax=Talaromyces proteolyticus TaxID=1131652 RepID=A0AAD4PX36_9EURO|nr:putative snare-dependent exocytosis protein [Talaromyces proteolyticus]KAH8692686.1 putative snare-dependent exocytosis protein [Talaromyces proteolyticus]